MNKLTEFQAQVVEVAVNKLFMDDFFSILTFDKIKDLVGVRVNRKDYKVLECLHCVYWRNMPKPFEKLVQEKIRELLLIPSVEINAEHKPRFAFWR